MTNKQAGHLLGAVAGLIAYAVIWVYYGPQLVLGVFLAVWSNNVSQDIKANWRAKDIPSEKEINKVLGKNVRAQCNNCKHLERVRGEDGLINGVCRNNESVYFGCEMLAGALCSSYESGKHESRT